MTKRKRTNDDLQNIAHKTKDQVTRTALKTGGELRSERIGSFCSTSGTCHYLSSLCYYCTHVCYINRTRSTPIKVGGTLLI
jgi:hypothetical protein